ncbi:hypothetical protein H8D85_01455 [bacterium]|nr:hypothetical protein [bacterium]
MRNTNKDLANNMNCTPRQISKSRKRGWITDSYGKKVKFTAPAAVKLAPRKSRDRE